MRKRGKILWIMAAVSLIVICFVPTWLMKWSWVDFTGKGNSELANSVNGFTAPVIGIVTSVFLFVNLWWQGENIELQRQHNEFQMISGLVDDVGESFQNFEFKVNKRDESVPGKTITIECRGMDAFKAMTQYFKEINKDCMPLSITRFTGATPFISILVKIERVKSEITKSRLSGQTKSIFLDHLYMHILSVYEFGYYMELFCRSRKLPNDLAYKKLKAFVDDYSNLKYTIDGEFVPVDTRQQG